jgi:sialidase-1
VYDRIKAGEFTWKYDFKDLHPSPYGQEVYFQTIKELLKKTKFPTREGFVNVPMLTAEAAGSSLDFEFKGRGVGIAIISGPDAGKITYTIDGKKPQTLDTYTPWSNQLHLPWYLMLADELSAGKHKLHLTISPDKNEKSEGNALRVVHLLVNE